MSLIRPSSEHPSINSVSHRQKAMCGAWGGVGPFFSPGVSGPYLPSAQKSWRGGVGGEELTIILFFSTVYRSPTVFSVQENTAASGFPLIGLLRGGAGESAVFKFTRAPLAWIRACLCVCVFVCVCLCERECQGGRVLWGNEWTERYFYLIIVKKRSGINLWRSVLILWHCATRWSMYGKHWKADSATGFGLGYFTSEQEQLWLSVQFA